MSDKDDKNGEVLCCSFCGKSQNEVKKLVAGRGVYICDECIEVCINIVADEMDEIADIFMERLEEDYDVISEDEDEE